MSNTFHEWLEDLPEPDPLTPAEFGAWRGLIRLRETVMRELDRRLRHAGEIPLSDYGILVTLVSAPDLRLRMTELGTRRLLTPSGITRVVDGLERRGLVRREQDPADGRASFASLTRAGLEALRRAQVVHHATVRELYLERLSEAEMRTLAGLFEKALPGTISAPIWPQGASP